LVCGKDCESTIGTTDGIEKIHSQWCTYCQDKKAHAEALLKLKEAVDDQRGVWEDISGIPGFFYGKTLDSFNSKLQPQAYKLIMEYYDNNMWENKCTDESGLPKSIVLISPNIYGVGKTHLICGLFNKIIKNSETAYVNRENYITRRSCPVYFTTETGLLDRIRRTYNRIPEEEGETESHVYAQLEGAELLAIDDVGKVKPRDISFLQGVYYRIIDSRYVNHKAIILTTNLDYPELEEHIGGACADRLREMAGNNFIKMTGKSYRHGAKDALPDK
jgi:DNA replication protein DnaC